VVNGSVKGTDNCYIQQGSDACGIAVTCP
jgi:hypothetical protein